MYGKSWKKVIVSSFVLSVAGIMTCMSALLSDLVPAWSMLAFLAVLIPLGLAIVGILAGFVWICDKCENYFADRKEKLLDPGNRKSGKKTGPNDQKTSDGANHRYIKYMPPLQDRVLEQYTTTLRPSRFTKPLSTIYVPPTKLWHGQ
jgi:hypothetical protein